jgi:hypothetical protein
MATDSSLPNVAAVPAAPLEYASEALDPFLPVIRKIALVLLVAGVLTIVNSSMQLFSMGRFAGPNRYMLWMMIVSIAKAGFEAAAGAMTMRNTTKLHWLWAWIWIDIIGTPITDLIILSGNIAMSPRQPIFAWVENSLIQLLWVPLGWVLPLCVMIVLVYRRRFVGGDAPR